jgi:hypothetical protein
LSVPSLTDHPLASTWMANSLALISDLKVRVIRDRKAFRRVSRNGRDPRNGVVTSGDYR